MDRREETTRVIVKLNEYNNGQIDDSELLAEVCEYFDVIKGDKLTTADKKFLIYLSAKVGVPHYYDIIKQFNADFSPDVDDELIDANTFASILYESSLYTDQNSKLHRYQMDVLSRFKKQQINRFFLSASTSFGKTHLVYEVIKKMNYDNIVLIFPSIALLSENLSKIKDRKVEFSKEYMIHTLSDSVECGDCNIFLFTPERFLSYLDKKDDSVNMDFIFIDEVYKIDNGYIIDNVAQENERDIAYRMAIFYGLSRFKETDLLLAGPYMEIFAPDNPLYNPSFDLFLEDYNIKKLIFNKYEIVKVDKYNFGGSKNKQIEDIIFNINKKSSKRDKIQIILNTISKNQENAIVYCFRQERAEKVAQEYIRDNISTAYFYDFIVHLKNTYHNDWIIIKALEKGVGVHHGLVPKYIQKEIINLFNDSNSGVNVLTSTTTITEGVNTTAKNMVVYSKTKGDKPLLPFDAKNIAGRAGRFMQHYKGRVISLESDFINLVESDGKQIEHNNYQSIDNRNEVDLDITKPEFLDKQSLDKSENINNIISQLGIPDFIMSQYKIVSKSDKLIIYNKIDSLSLGDRGHIRTFISYLNHNAMSINIDGFQVILNCIVDIVKHENLKILIDNKFSDRRTNQKYSILFMSLNTYIKAGFNGVFKYELEKDSSNNRIDNAMRHSSSLIFNTFKYQLVKYLGVFNVIYQYIESKKQGRNVAGIDRLLTKLEYNAFNSDARIASDYGAPQKVVNYYDCNDKIGRENLYKSMDNYEKVILDRINKII